MGTSFILAQYFCLIDIVSFGTKRIWTNESDSFMLTGCHQHIERWVQAISAMFNYQCFYAHCNWHSQFLIVLALTSNLLYCWISRLNYCCWNFKLGLLSFYPKDSSNFGAFSDLVYIFCNLLLLYFIFIYIRKKKKF